MYISASWHFFFRQFSGSKSGSSVKIPWPLYHPGVSVLIYSYVDLDEHIETYYVYNVLPAGMYAWTEEHASLQTPIQLADERKWSSGHSQTLSTHVASPVSGFKSKFAG